MTLPRASKSVERCGVFLLLLQHAGAASQSPADEEQNYLATAAMGAKSSLPSLTLEQEDIKHLGDRYPFGDDELSRLYRAYQAFCQSEKGVSLFSDFAVLCTVLPPGEEDPDGSKLKELQVERSMLMSVVESKIFPEAFSEKLEDAAFFRLQERKEAPLSHDYEQDEYTRVARLEKFLDGVSNGGGRRGGRKALGTLFQCFVDCAEHPDDSSHMVHKNGNEIMAYASPILDAAFRLSLAVAFLRNSNNNENMGDFIPSPDVASDRVMKALCQSIMQNVRRKKIRLSPYGTLEAADESDFQNGLVSKMDFIEWSELNAPLLSSALPSLMHEVFFPDRPYPPSLTPFNFPRIEAESAFFDNPTSPLLFSIASMSSSLGGTWHRLYTSTSDGLSFNRLQNSLLGYGGPTLIVIESTAGGIFGAFTASSWKESKDFYGNSDCFLYQLLPFTSVYRPRGNGTNYMYCNSEARSRGYDGLAHGIGFGGTNLEPRLFISESFDGCLASSEDLTFENGPLLPPRDEGETIKRTFEIENLEVWGVGGDHVVADALESRDRQREVTAANIRKARKVDKAAFLDDFRNGVIESKAFQHRDQIRGRADCAVEERHQDAYAYEK